MSCRIDLWLATPSAATLFRPDELNFADAERWTRIRSPKRRRDWEVSRALLAHVRPSPQTISSLSHSNGFAALAIVGERSCADAQLRLGVDLEFVRPRDFASLSQFAFHPAEQCSDAALFYTRWTLKEAAAKALNAPLLAILRSAFAEVVAPPTRCVTRVFAPRESLILSVVAIVSADASVPEIEIVTHDWPGETKNDWTLLA